MMEEGEMSLVSTLCKSPQGAISSTKQVIILTIDIIIIIIIII
jgi:hypothetical protein